MKVTIGQLLGIAKQAKALQWDQLATEFKKVEKINALKNTAAATLSSMFSTVLGAFSLTKKAADLIQKARRIITMAVKIAGVIKNWAMAGEIASDLLLLVQKFLLQIAIAGIGQIRDYILAIEIDLGDLSLKQLKALQEKITKSLNDSFEALGAAIDSFDPAVLAPDLAAFVESFKSFDEELKKTEWDSFLNAVGDTLFALGQDALSRLNIFQSEYNDSLKDNLNQTVYGSADKILTGTPPAYVASPDLGIFVQKDITLIEPATNNGDTTWLDFVAEDTDVSRELMDNINKAIQQNVSALLGSLYNSLKTIDPSVADIENDIYTNNKDPSSDIEILHNLRDGFLNYIRDSQYTLSKDALNAIFKLNDYNLRKILNMFLEAFGNAYKDRNSLIAKLMSDYINFLLASGEITDPEIFRQMLLDYLAILQENLNIDAAEIFRKVLYEYLKFIFGSSGINNEERTNYLVQKSIDKFYNYKKDFLLSIIEKIKRIRIQNDTIDENYFVYSYDALKNSLILETNNFINVETLISNYYTIINNFIISCIENAPHPQTESIEEKLNILKSTLFDTIKKIINDEPIPEIIWNEVEWINATDKEKEILRAIMAVIFQDYKKKLLKIISDSLYTFKYSTIKLINKENAESIISNYIVSEDILLRNKIYNDLIYIINYYGIDTGEDFIGSLLYFINNFNYNLNYSFKFASVLKENEIHYIEQIVTILKSN